MTLYNSTDIVFITHKLLQVETCFQLFVRTGKRYQMGFHRGFLLKRSCVGSMNQDTIKCIWNRYKVGMNNTEKLVTILTTNLAIASTDRRGVCDSLTLHSSRNKWI